MASAATCALVITVVGCGGSSPDVSVVPTDSLLPPAAQSEAPAAPQTSSPSASTPFVSASPRPATAAAPQTSPPAAGTPFVSAPPSAPRPVAELAPMSLAIVTVAELNVRVAPSTSAELLEVFPSEGLITPIHVKTPLPRGSRVLVLHGPVEADGYRWYMAGLTSEVGTPVGWIAAGTERVPWLRPDDAPCPTGDLPAISKLTPLQRVACFGTLSLTFEARQVTIPEDAGFGGVCAAKPLWLSCASITYNWVHADGDTDARLTLHFDPVAGIEETGLADPGTIGPLWELRGHFGDPAAVECGSGLAPQSIEYHSAWLDCASHFVVEAVNPAS